ncbi:T9SS type A sorting domain-containing protein [Panacibacter ginsenosidivorans]|uniref:T9SS type A sorting domain-containing protein n=1 Tax=Panacibacter ginsenosidivorans TaxID=1813871 RepID=A0A5B8VAI6_9BACT|nr:ELWxxDGT repeat protein [Panacibacter ginsenosidivorans]QEC68510.1 T9SS type A sorting domain-containing protein [Panacibacter ginsenosidivorans]
MKHTLHFFLFVLVFTTVVNAQVTKLANNNNIQTGFALGSTGILIDNNDSLWKTDGTAAGTSLYAHNVRVNTESGFAILNNKLYFSGTNAADGVELWVTDGTAAGTTIVKDIVAGFYSSSPAELYVFNNTIYFFASTAAEGTELWRSDGTAAGTILVKDINPGINSSLDNYANFFINNNILYFTANDDAHGTELWKTNGTAAGTVLVKDINNGSGSSDCTEFTAFGTLAIFAADNGINGKEVWVTDGSANGTKMVKDIVAGAGPSSPTQFILFKNKIYFTTVENFIQYKLYVTDGTDAGTTVVKDFTGGYAQVAFAIYMQDKFYFTALNSTNGTELWNSDGTATGTTLFKDIQPGKKSSNAFVFPNITGITDYHQVHNNLYNGKIFMMADNGTNGNELWISDGTDGGTKMVKDVNPGTGAAFDFPAYYYTSKGLYFAADDGTNGTELFKSDGTDASMIKDINTGSESSNPNFIMTLNNKLIFTANDGDNTNGDIDLYQVDETILPLTLLDFTAVLNGKAAQLEWSTSTEVNTKDFTIQRSFDGYNFQSIGSVTAAGNSTQKRDYKFIDAGALGTGYTKIYYRLQMNDKDNKFTYSKIEIVTIKNNAVDYSVYPNPVKNILTISFPNALTHVSIIITDQQGKVLLTQQLNNIQQGYKASINMAAYKSGIYYLQVKTNDGAQTNKIIKF